MKRQTVTVTLTNIDDQWSASLALTHDLGSETYTAYGQAVPAALRGLADLVEAEQR